MRWIALCVMMLAGMPGPADAQKVYEGREAIALRCANTLALTAVALGRSELISPQEQDVMLQITFEILSRHVSGTWAQKKAAMKVMRDRRSVPDTLDDYRANAARCLADFPIN